MPKVPKPPNYPNNKKTLRHISVNDLPDLPFGPSPSAKNLKLTCPNGHQFTPNWRAKLGFEYAPFQITLQSGEKVSYAPASINVPCSMCQSQTEIQFPSPSINRGKIELHGDESYHLSADRKRYFFAYAFVGTYAEGRKFLQIRMDAFKKKILPDAEPGSWHFHANEIRQPKWRKKHHVKVSIEEINQELRLLGSSLSEIHDQRAVFVTVCPVLNIEKLFKDNRKTRDGVRDIAISFAMYSATDTLTQLGFSPNFVLENVNNHAQPQFMDNAVERVARSLFCNLSYLYAARSRVEMLPTTEEKGISVEMEFADLVAFSTNRAFFQRNLGQQPQLPLEMFGPVCWSAFTQGKVGVSITDGFPWDAFYPGF